MPNNLWSNLELPMEESKTLRRSAAHFVLSAIDRFAPAHLGPVENNAKLQGKFNKLFLSKEPCNSPSATRVHFYMFNYNRWTLENVTPAIYTLLTAKKATPAQVKLGMLLPFSGPGIDIPSILSSEIHQILDREIKVEWIKPSEEVLNNL